MPDAEIYAESILGVTFLRKVDYLVFSGHISYLYTYQIKRIMSKRVWIIPIVIVAVNALAILIRWSSLPETLLAHFDLQGNAGGSMPRNTLLWYPLAGAMVCGIAYVIARKVGKQGLQTGLIIMASGIGLFILSSTMVTLTRGTMPVFMLAEPVILVAAIVAFVICLVKGRK